MKSTEVKVPEPRQLPSGKWFIQLRIKGQSYSITRDSKDQCIKEAQRVKLGAKRKPKEIKSDCSLSKAIDEYIEARSNLLSVTTIRCYRQIQNNRFEDLMAMDVNEITLELLQAAVNAESKLSAKTLKNGVMLVSAVLGAKDIQLNISKIKYPQRKKKEKAALEPSQIVTLLKAIDGHELEPLIYLELWLGLRRSEALALYWESVDFENKTIKIERTIVPNEDNQYVIQERTKTEDSCREIDCPDIILDMLKAIKPKKAQGRIFEYPPDAVGKRINRICKKAGIPETGQHGLRHTNATVMMLLNVPDKVAMGRGGWSTDYTMKRVYQHATDSASKAAADSIDSYFNGLVENANENANESASD